MSETANGTTTKADVGSVFISNYPPFSFWEQEQAGALHQKLAEPPKLDAPLGLYLHIPFCRKRCKFCYFKVYTDKNSKEIQSYLDAVKQEIKMLAEQPAVKGRKVAFLYVGGGTPSYISARHLEGIVGEIREHFDLSELQEFTFECEPGTLTERKLEAIRDVGVTRLSLGVENFDDTVLSENGRAHVSTEIYRVRPWIRQMGFQQFNIDLISGMVGESWENWKTNIEKAIEFDPDSITIYQLELPYNTVYSGAILDGSSQTAFADWPTKRSWHDYAIETLSQAGFDISSGYTMVKRDRGVKFLYRDALWHGADLLALGCSSFGHLNGLHYQNQPGLGGYVAEVEAGHLPVKRAYQTSEENRLIREVILQLKLGRITTPYFEQKYGVNIIEHFRPMLEAHREDGFLTFGEDEIRLTRDGLLRVDALLPAFYESRFQNARYT